MKGHRDQLTVRLEPQVMQAVRHRSQQMNDSLSNTVAQAAKESLLSSYRSDREQEILKAVDRNLYALRKLERVLRLELSVLKEMVGLGMRSFFNHTTPIPEATKNAALRSGKERFHRYLDLLAANLRQGESILRDLPLAAEGDKQPQTNEPRDAKTTAEEPPPPKRSAHNDEHQPKVNRNVVHPLAHSSTRADRGLFEQSNQDI